MISNFFNNSLNAWDTGFHESPTKTPVTSRTLQLTRKNKPNYNHRYDPYEWSEVPQSGYVTKRNNKNNK